jgi:hypothetical protein
MDPDLVMQRLTNAALFLGGAVVLVLLATWLVGRICRGAGLPAGLTVLAQVLTPVALFYAGSLYLDAAGSVAAAKVERKNEYISYANRIPGGWNRSYWATVQFATADGPTDAALWLDETTFDALTPGTALDVRYVPWFPHLARPASASTRTLVPWRWLARAAAVAGAGVVLWLALRRRRPALMAVLFFLAIAFGVVWWVFPTPWDTPLEAPVLTTEAEVRDVRDVTRAFVSGRALGAVDPPQPWQLVELHFVPEGRTEPVIALDGVDEGSVANLTIGARVPITYSATSPRDVRLDGTRTYRWREWLELGQYLALLAVMWGGVWLASRLFTLWWRGLTRPS